MDWNKEIIFSYFEKNGINSDFETEPELFKFYMSKPEEMLKKHILNTIHKGEIILKNDEYCLIQWCQNLLGTEIVIQKTDDTFKIISAYPACYESNRNSNGIWYPDEDEINNRTEASVGANPFDYFDNRIVFEHEAYTDGIGDDFDFCYFGFAFAANTDFHTYLKEKQLAFSYKDYDCIGDEVNPITKIQTKLKDLALLKHLGKKFYYFMYGEDIYDQAIPVFIPAKILPRGTELFADDEIELQIMLFGHQAVYINPDEPLLEYFKFGVISALTGERIKSRAQIKQERIDYQYEFPEKNKETVELKSKPAEYFIRIIDAQKSYEDQIIEQCEVFKEKFGVYPNMIVANSETFDKWEESIKENIGDQEASDFYELSLFEDIEKNNSLMRI